MIILKHFSSLILHTQNFPDDQPNICRKKHQNHNPKYQLDTKLPSPHLVSLLISLDKLSLNFIIGVDVVLDHSSLTMKFLLDVISRVLSLGSCFLHIFDLLVLTVDVVIDLSQLGG